MAGHVAVVGATGAVGQEFLRVLEQRRHRRTDWTVKCGLAMTVPLLTGCWSGHRMADLELAYRHPSVRWVYRAGGQIGLLLGMIPSPVDNHIRKLQRGPNCVIVPEGGPGCVVSSLWEPVTALDLDTGLPTFGQPTGHEQNRLKTEYRDFQWVANLEPNLQLVCPSSRELVVRRPGSPPEGQIRLLALRGARSGGSLIPSFAIMYPDEVLVIASEDHVICTDLKRIPQLADPSPLASAPICAAEEQQP